MPLITIIMHYTKVFQLPLLIPSLLSVNLLSIYNGRSRKIFMLAI